MSHAADIDADAVREQLQRILASDGFSSAPLLGRFLRYVVESRLDVPATPPKEYTIGVEVLQRGAAFDPVVDTSVRVHARRLRARLARYYQDEGRGDPIRIAIPKGHYQAEFTRQVPRPEVTAEPLDRTGPLAPAAMPWRQTFRTHAIPAPRTPLVARTREVAELCELLVDDAGPRLVTLTGAAGSGKTGLAIEVGLRWQAALAEDAIFVSLGNITDLATFQLALLRAFGLCMVDNTPPGEVICRHLHGIARAPHLILDNFEQLVEAAPLVGSLLDACISLKVLVTSRVALHLYGECAYPVLPLALPEKGSMALGELGAVPAVELFTQRAAAVHSGFSLTADNARAAAEICRRCDGLPLGIELAAAQCRTLTPAQVLARFPRPLDIPAGNTADVPDRQRTLRHAIEWSHELLGDPERRLFRRLAAFSGGFTLEAAEAVANLRRDAGIDVGDGVLRLLDRNLLYQVADEYAPRFAMLETIRDYGRERLVASGEHGDIGRAHAAYFLVLAEEGTAHLDDKTRKRWLARCDVERDNFRAALAGLIERGDGEWSLRLVWGLYQYWERRGYLDEARGAFQAVLKHFKPSTDPAMWARIACCVGTIEGRMGKPAVAQGHLAHGLAVARQAGDRSVEIMALTSQAVHLGLLERHAAAAAMFEECLHLCETSGSKGETAAALGNLAVARLALGEHETARGLMERALESFRSQKEWAAVGWCLNQLGDVAMVAGRHAEASAWYQRSAQQFLKLGDFLGMARCWTDLGHLALQQGNYAGAAGLFADALRIYGKQGFQRGVVNLVEVCAALAVARGRYPEALVLAGAANAIRSARKLVAYPYQQARLDTALRPAREALTPVEISACRQRGAALDAERAVGHVRRLLAEVGADAPTEPVGH